MKEDPAEPVAERRTERLKRAREFLEPYIKDIETALVLGTGLAEIANEVNDAVSVAYQDIPGFPLSDVKFHPGRLICGNFITHCCVLQGRYHLYEGHSFKDVVFPIDVLAALGIKRLILTHAAGGIRKHLRPGSLAYLKDQVNLTGVLFHTPQYPLPNAGLVDMTDVFAPYLQQLANNAARQTGVTLYSAVLGGISGPSLPTEAEIHMYRTMGIDVIGMSVVPEVVRARQCGIDVLALTAVTDQSLPGAMQKVTISDVKQIVEKQRPMITKLLHYILKEIEHL